MAAIFNLSLPHIPPEGINGHCSDSDIQFKSSRCANLLKPAKFKLEDVMKKNIHAWSKYELDAICRNKEDFEICYQLMLYDCREKRKETRAVLEYFHDTFDYLCNRGHKIYFEVMPCLIRMGVNAAISQCTDYGDHSTHLCRHLQQLISCTGKWAQNNCGKKAADFTETILESGLTFVRDHIHCQNQTDNEYACSLSNIERRIDHCASNLELSELDLATFIIDPVPDWTEHKLTVVCRNLPKFKFCYDKLISECDNKGQELRAQLLFIMDTLQFLCNEGRIHYLIHNRCLIQYPLSTVRSQCLIQGRMNILGALDKAHACRRGNNLLCSRLANVLNVFIPIYVACEYLAEEFEKWTLSDVTETINCAADAAQHECNANAKQFTKMLYQRSLHRISEKNDCSEQISDIEVAYDVTSTENIPNIINSKKQSSTKLGSGAIAGIVIGCLLMCTVGIGLMVFYRKKEKAKPERVINMRSTTTSTSGVSEFVSCDPFRPPRPFSAVDGELVDSAPPSYEQAIRSNYKVSEPF